MKPICYLAASLLFLTGVLHILPMFKTTYDLNLIPMLVFGIIYLIIWVLLIVKIKFDSLLGIIFPLIGSGTGSFVVGIKNWNNILTFIFLIDVIVVICRLILLLNKR
jgi:hypothetical protein